jgi:hypothetical protein
MQTLTKKPGVWMAVLTFTALILAVLLIATPAREAQAVMINAQPGFTLMTSGTAGGDEYLFVIDNSTNKMGIYKLNGNSLDVMGGMDYGRLFNGPAPRGR